MGVGALQWVLTKCYFPRLGNWKIIWKRYDIIVFARQVYKIILYG